MVLPGVHCIGVAMREDNLTETLREADRRTGPTRFPARFDWFRTSA